jgi:acetylornithine deacetylase/succinyl-diaminopimelate desuccinylase-like protein
VTATLVGDDPNRQNLVATIRGRGTGPSLLLLGHTDVVVADPDEWSVQPFSGLDRDEQIWGRGALDMKGQVAAETVAFARLAREGWQGNGDLVLCAVADEEVGNGVGAIWIVAAHPELVRTDYVLNEGGGERLPHGDRVVYNVDVGEKRCSAFEITVRGRSGHASTAFVENNALLKLVPVIERIDRMARPEHDLPELRAFLAAIGEAGSDPVALARASRESNPALAEVLGPMLGAVITPTGLEGSGRASLNVIPGRCVLRCDCRILPGQSQEQIQSAVAEALDGIEYEFEFLENVGGTASAPDSPLFEVISDFVPQIEAGAVAVPTISSGFTDSHFFRQAYGNVAYGFMPKRTDPLETWPLIHSADERVAKDDLELATEFFLHAARAIGELE